MVIAYVREVISWETIALEDDDVGVVVLEFDLAADSVDEGGLSIMVAIGIEADDPWGAGFDLGDSFIDGEVTVSGPGAIVAWKRLDGFLRFADVIEILWGAEVWVSTATTD